MPVTSVSLLLRLRRDADAASWAEFVRVYEPLLTGYVQRCGLQPADVADVVQEIFVRLLRGLPQFEYRAERGRFRDWLQRVCRNAVTDWHRRRPRHRGAAAYEKAAVDPEPSWERAHHRQILEHALRTVREDVSDRVWLCFERYVLQGCDAGEVARALGLKRSAVYVIASRVRHRLQRKCAQFDEDLSHADARLSR